jgi:hypothetical protein
MKFTIEYIRRNGDRHSDDDIVVEALRYLRRLGLDVCEGDEEESKAQVELESLKIELRRLVQEFNP